MTPEELTAILRANGFRVPYSELVPAVIVQQTLGVSARTLYDWRMLKVGPPAVSQNGRWFYRVPDIAKHISNGSR
jgi:hypothetical protein